MREEEPGTRIQRIHGTAMICRETARWGGEFVGIDQGRHLFQFQTGRVVRYSKVLEWVEFGGVQLTHWLSLPGACGACGACG